MMGGDKGKIYYPLNTNLSDISPIASHTIPMLNKDTTTKTFSKRKLVGLRNIFYSSFELRPKF